jgi:hypothetical protein
MSNLLRTTAPKMGLVLGLVALSFGASAKQITLHEMVGYSINQQMQEIKFDMQAQLMQSTYNMAFANLNTDAGIPGRRPVVSISDVDAAQEDEE